MRISVAGETSGLQTMRPRRAGSSGAWTKAQPPAFGERRALCGGVRCPAGDASLQAGILATVRRVAAQELDGETGTVQSADTVAYFL
ncbi:hypothetical protein GGR01_002054 [Acetobacter oeni]|nr:hypothetical protein [Acetobacter oeni]